MITELNSVQDRNTVSKEGHMSWMQTHVVSRAEQLTASCPKTLLASQPLHTSLSTPLGHCTGRAKPTVYFQQLGFGLCHPCTRQSDLPSLCSLCQLSSLPTSAGNHQRTRGWPQRPKLLVDPAAGGLHLTSARRKTLWTHHQLWIVWAFDVLINYFQPLTEPGHNDIIIQYTSSAFRLNNMYPLHYVVTLLVKALKHDVSKLLLILGSV